MRRVGMAAALAVALIVSGQAEASPASSADKNATASRIHSWRLYERGPASRGQQLNQIEQQRSRPVPPTSPNSRVVPNR